MDSRLMEQDFHRDRIPVHSDKDRINALIESKYESRLNMYERQIDQLFDFTYNEKDDIKTLFQENDNMKKTIDHINKKVSDSQMNEFKICIQNYYHLAVENKRRLDYSEWYNFQIFIVQICIIGYLIYLRFI